MFSRFIQGLPCTTAVAFRCNKRYAHASATLDWKDPLDLASRFTDEELAIQETARSYSQEKLGARVLGGFASYGSKGR